MNAIKLLEDGEDLVDQCEFLDAKLKIYVWMPRAKIVDWEC